MSGAGPSTMFKHCIPQYPNYFNSPINQYWVNEKFKGILAEQQRAFIDKNLNPFNICPSSVTFWFPITKFIFVGMTVSSFKKVLIVVRQPIEPNETISLIITILQLQLPFPLTLLTMFSSLGLWVNGAVNNLLETVPTQLMNIPDITADHSLLVPEAQPKTWDALNPFNLTPRLTVTFPIFGTHTRINLGFWDFQRVAISIKQFLEPQDVIYTLIRSIELKVPFQLTILALFLSIGLFINGSLNAFEQRTRIGIKNEVNRIFQEYRK